tara:strand:+ start:4260 stop:4577 length:318 start_codon:yes stop_codon:yes gene_type:complete
MRDETKYFIEQVKLKNQLDEIQKQNTREFDDYFANSGKIEQTSKNVDIYQSVVRRDYKIRRKVHGVFLEVLSEQEQKNRSKYENYLKSLEIDLAKYIKHDDKEYW